MFNQIERDVLGQKCLSRFNQWCLIVRKIPSKFLGEFMGEIFCSKEEWTKHLQGTDTWHSITLCEAFLYKSFKQLSLSVFREYHGKMGTESEKWKCKAGKSVLGVGLFFFYFFGQRNSVVIILSIKSIYGIM